MRDTPLAAERTAARGCDSASGRLRGWNREGRRAVRLPSGLRVLFSQLLFCLQCSPRHLVLVSFKGRSSFPACPSFVNVTLVPFLVLAVRCSAESHRAWPMSRSSCSKSESLTTASRFKKAPEPHCDAMEHCRLGQSLAWNFWSLL